MLLFISLAMLGVILLLHLIAVTHTAYPDVVIHTCSDAIRYYDYQHNVPRSSQSQVLRDVQLMDQVTAGQPSALVTVLEGNPPSSISVYVYGCTMQHNHPQIGLLLERQHLLQGSAIITRANTLSISALDTNVAPEIRSTLQQNIYREYAWKNGAFTQVSFSGLYPVTSQAEAEELQQQSNTGQSMPWLDPLTTTTQMAKDLLRWNDSNMSVTVQDNDGITAHALLVQQTPHIEVAVSLQRLIQRDSGGLWFVTRAQSHDLTLNTSHLPAAVTSPLLIQVRSASSAGNVAVTLFDHTLTPIPSSKPTFSMQSNDILSSTISFTTAVSKQPGLLLLTQVAPDGQSGQLLLTNLVLD
jgi:hypothetical protein